MVFFTTIGLIGFVYMIILCAAMCAGRYTIGVIANLSLISVNIILLSSKHMRKNIKFCIISSVIMITNGCMLFFLMFSLQN